MGRISVYFYFILNIYRCYSKLYRYIFLYVYNNNSAIAVYIDHVGKLETHF